MSEKSRGPWYCPHTGSKPVLFNRSRGINSLNTDVTFGDEVFLFMMPFKEVRNPLFVNIFFKK